MRLKYLISLAPRAGFEPATNRLTAGCSTAELPGKSLLAWQRRYNKAGPALKASPSRNSSVWIGSGIVAGGVGRWEVINELEATPGIEPG